MSESFRELFLQNKSFLIISQDKNGKVGHVFSCWQQDLILTYKLLFGYLDVDPNTILIFHPQAYDSYQGPLIANNVLRLMKPNFKLDCRKNFFGIRVVDPWNNLPNDMKLSKTLKEFKSKLMGTATGQKVDMSPFLKSLS